MTTLRQITMIFGVIRSLIAASPCAVGWGSGVGIQDEHTRRAQFVCQRLLNGSNPFLSQ
jgi:hypothetical protein